MCLEEWKVDIIIFFRVTFIKEVEEVDVYSSFQILIY